VISLKCSLCASRRPSVRERPKQREDEEEEEEEEKEEEEEEGGDEEEEEDEPVVKKQKNRKRKLEVLVVSDGRGKSKLWKCLVCTLSNALEAKRCEACYSYRPADVVREVETAIEKKNKAKKKRLQQQQKEQRLQQKKKRGGGSTPGRKKKEIKGRKEASSSNKKRRSVDEDDEEDTSDENEDSEEEEDEEEKDDEEHESSSEGGYKSDEDGSGGWMTKQSSSSSSSFSSKVLQQQRETEWTCTQCTLVNSIRSRVCELCGITRAFAIRGEAPKIVKPREATAKVLKFPHRESRVGVDFQVNPECFPTAGLFVKEGHESSSNETMLIESELFETVWIAPTAVQTDDEGTEMYLARFPAHQIRALQMLCEMNYELERAAVEMQQLIDNGLVQQEQVYTKAVFEDEEAKQAFASALSKCGEEWKKVRLELGCRYNIRQLQDLFYGTFVNKECKPMRLEAERKYRIVLEREKEEKKRKAAQAAYEAKKALLSCASTSRDEGQNSDDAAVAASTSATPPPTTNAMDIAEEDENKLLQRQQLEKEAEEAEYEAEGKTASNGHFEEAKCKEAKKAMIVEVAV